MTRAAALLRAPPGRRFTRLAHGSATFVSRSTGQPRRTARPLTRMGESIQGTADPRDTHRPSALPPSQWMHMWLLAAINGGLISQRAGNGGCRKCSSKKGQAVEVVLGVPDPVGDECSESEGSKNDHEEQTADRLAEKLGLTQFLWRRKKKRGGRGRDQGHFKSETAPKCGGGGGRGAGAGGAAGLLAGVIAVSMVPRSGGPVHRAPSALMLPPHLPQLPVVRPPPAGRSSAGAPPGCQSSWELCALWLGWGDCLHRGHDPDCAQ